LNNLNLFDQVYFPCDFCSCIFECDDDLKAHINKNHGKQSKSEYTELRIYASNLNRSETTITPPLSDDEVVTPKNKTNERHRSIGEVLTVGYNVKLNYEISLI
jgi:hypothetical protein